VRLPDRLTDLLIEREAYRVCPLLRLDEFVRLCRDRTIVGDAGRLRKLERLHLFLPLLRICRPDQTRKVEYVDGGARYRDLGPMREGEAWDGATRNELAGFDFDADVIRSWREHGYAWDPRADDNSHAQTIDTDPDRHEAYYSLFQIYELQWLTSQLTPTVHVEWAVEDNGSLATEWGTNLREQLGELADRVMKARGKLGPRQVLGPLCQLISDRYYPKTQTDKRRVTFTAGLPPFDDWDWYAYARTWDARTIVDSFELAESELRAVYEALAFAQQHADPLADWHHLVQFVSIEKRKRLRGDALKAMTLREMAHMLRLFYHDVFGKTLDSPDEIGQKIFHRIPDISADEDPLRALELVANDFGVNPKPQLVLFLEGLTEITIVPLIFSRMFGATPSVYGIELTNLGGVSNAAGGKENPFSAVWRLIDYLHHHQTIAFVLMDNEGYAARNIGLGLRRAGSIHFPDRRATRPDYIKLWKLSFEFDNFSDTELARALTVFADDTAFSRADIYACRESVRKPPKKGPTRTIEVLYAERTGVRLDKPAFGRALVELMFCPVTRRAPANRPIARFLKKVAHVAARNHQPTTHAMWEYNQRTGHLGTLKPGAVFRRKHPFRQSRKRTTTTKEEG
jgi:hypothetical protein